MARPLHQFVLDYLELCGADRDLVEPQVYDLLLPPELASSLELGRGFADEMVRLLFDAEAVADYPNGLLVSCGTPFLDALLKQAQQGGCKAQLFDNRYAMPPYNLEKRMRSLFSLPKGAGLRFDPATPYYFTTHFYWFQGTLVSDEKLQYPFQLAIQRYHGRPERRPIGQLIEQGDPFPSLPYPFAGGLSLEQTYLLARQEAVGKMEQLLQRYRSSLQIQASIELTRIRHYFAELRSELAAKKKETIDSALRALALEEEARLHDVEKKLSLRGELQLMNLLLLHRIHYLIEIEIEGLRKAVPSLKLIWDPLEDAFLPMVCPHCSAPTMQLTLHKEQLSCPLCIQGSH